MPDLRPANAYRREMTAIERRYIRRAGEPMKEARAAIIEAIATGGSAQAVLPLIRREVDALRQRVNAISGEFKAPLNEAAGNLARKNFDLVERLTEATPNFNAAQASTASDREQTLTLALANITAWLDTLDIRLRLEYTRMLSAEEETEAIINRLMAERIADGRVSVWRAQTNRMASDSQIDLWTAGAALAGLYYAAGEAQTGQKWRKQAIAAIDERTTDCCLRVHGQVQDRDKPFRLTGTPRFSDQKQNPPFHRYCRTATTLWIEEFEAVGVTTDEMRSAANAELEARERTGERVKIHPASAISRRSG